MCVKQKQIYFIVMLYVLSFKIFGLQYFLSFRELLSPK